MKYFFLTDGWSVGRVWEFGGLWNESAWRRKPHIEQMSLCVWNRGEQLWLYQVEDTVLMLEVKPTEAIIPTSQPIGQVVLKQLMSGDEAIAFLCSREVMIERTLEEEKQ